MTNNQQKIIDSLIAEFNARNETKEKSNFKLINVDEFDEINNLHKELLEDSRRTKELWDSQRAEYIEELINKLRNDLGGRLIVNRGDIATDNSNYSTSIFIYKHGTERYMMNERAFRFNVVVLRKSIWNDKTKSYYDEHNNMAIRRYVSGNEEKQYDNENELFNCDYTKKEIKDLLNK